MDGVEQKSNCRLLVVDDNQSIHDDVRKLLAPETQEEAALANLEQTLFGDSDAAQAQEESFEVDSAFQGEEALQRVQAARAQGRPYSVAFVDIRMPPGWDGVETIERLWGADPDLQTVICSAYSDYTWSEISSRLVESERLMVLKKPFGKLELKQMAHALSRRWTLNREVAKMREAQQHTLGVAYGKSIDPLTALPDRGSFKQQLHKLFTTTGSDPARHAVCYVSLDRFRVVNAVCGHDGGDKLLQMITELLQKHVDSRDLVARLSNDEFGLLLTDCSLGRAEQVAGVLRAAIEAFRFQWRGITLRVSASIGLAPFNSRDDTFGNVVSAAECARNVVKELGGNRVYVSRRGDDELAKQQREMEWVVQINQALESDRFCLFRQPIVAVNDPSNESMHCELLIRMLDENGGLMPPAAFLQVAERYHLSTQIDQWVIRTAFEWMKRRTQQCRPRVCAINLSGHSLTEDGFLQFVLNHLDAAQVSGSDVCFEITETATIANVSSAITFISALKSRGCQFALDDFGTGMSSFAYLQQLPVDYVKIDGTFIRNIAEDAVACAMVKSINEVSHEMGKKTIAEFVENDAIMTKLGEIGVDYAQGYGVGRPRPLDAESAGNPAVAKIVRE